MEREELEGYYEFRLDFKRRVLHMEKPMTKEQFAQLKAERKSTKGLFWDEYYLSDELMQKLLALLKLDKMEPIGGNIY